MLGIKFENSNIDNSVAENMEEIQDYLLMKTGSSVIPPDAKICEFESEDAAFDWIDGITEDPVAIPVAALEPVPAAVPATPVAISVPVVKYFKKKYKERKEEFEFNFDDYVGIIFAFGLFEKNVRYHRNEKTNVGIGFGMLRTHKADMPFAMTYKECSRASDAEKRVVKTVLEQYGKVGKFLVVCRTPSVVEKFQNTEGNFDVCHLDEMSHKYDDLRKKLFKRSSEVSRYLGYLTSKEKEVLMVAKAKY